MQNVWIIVTALKELEVTEDMSPVEYAINTPKNARKITLIAPSEPIAPSDPSELSELSEPIEPIDLINPINPNAPVL